MELVFLVLGYIPMIKLDEIFILAGLTEDECRSAYKAILGKEINHAIKLSIIEKLSQNEPLNALRDVMEQMKYKGKGKL